MIDDDGQNVRLHSAQRNAIRKSTGIAPEPSFIFSSGIPINEIQRFLKMTEYQEPAEDEDDDTTDKNGQVVHVRKAMEPPSAQSLGDFP